MLIQVRNQSTKSNRPSPKDVWKKIQLWLTPFMDGFKSLSSECKEAWAAKQKLGKAMPLTRREMFVLRQAPRDLLHSLPLVVFFMIPGLGYAAPALGYKFPRQTLPWQFWTKEQTRLFFQQELQEKEKYYPAVQKHMKDNVSQEPTDPLHVKALAQAWALYPSIFIGIVPETLARRRLLRTTDEIQVDDELLLKEGLDKLSINELKFACKERGLLVSQDQTQMQKDLAKWLELHKSRPSPWTILHAPVVRWASKV